MSALSLTSKVLPLALFLNLFSLGNTVETRGDDALGSIQELQKRVDHLENLLISSGKEQITKLESVESKYDARIQQLEFRLDIVLSFHAPCPATIEQESSRNEVTSGYKTTQNKESVFEGTCSGFAEELKTTLRSFEHLLNSSMAKFEEERGTLFEAMSQISTIHSTVNSTWDELADHRRNWNNVNKKPTQCKEGWYFFEDSCYYFSHTVGNWTYGRSQCLAMGGDYVKVSTNGEWNFIASHINNSDSWIGLTDTEEEGIYRWISDGSIETEINKAWWHNDEPNNQGDENCIHYRFEHTKNLWNDKSCDVYYRYICEMEPESESA